MISGSSSGAEIPSSEDKDEEYNERRDDSEFVQLLEIFSRYMKGSNDPERKGEEEGRYVDKDGSYTGGVEHLTGM